MNKGRSCRGLGEYSSISNSNLYVPFVKAVKRVIKTKRRDRVTGCYSTSLSGESCELKRAVGIDSSETKWAIFGRYQISDRVFFYGSG